MATSEVSIELGNLAEHALLVDGCGGPDDGWLGSPNQAHLSVILFLIQFKFSLWREYEVVSPRCFNSNEWLRRHGIISTSLKCIYVIEGQSLCISLLTPGTLACDSDLSEASQSEIHQ